MDKIVRTKSRPIRAVLLNQSAAVLGVLLGFPRSVASTGTSIPRISVMSCHNVGRLASMTITDNDALGPGCKSNICCYGIDGQSAHTVAMHDTDPGQGWYADLTSASRR